MGEQALNAVSLNASAVSTKNMDRILIGCAIVAIVVVLVIMFTVDNTKKDEPKIDYSYHLQNATEYER